MIRLHVFLRDQGYGSRRKVEELIAAGRVLVDGKVAQLGQQVSGDETIEIDNRPVDKRKIGGDLAYQYLLANKPVGYTSTTVTHFSGEKSVLELLPYAQRVATQWQIVGRLDKNSEGLLLLTNHGQLCYIMTHPKFEIEKEYEVTLNRELTAEEIKRLLGGVVAESGERYLFRSVQISGSNTYRVILTEGKKREIREAIAILGARVIRLVRVRLGELQLGGLATGGYREITDVEKGYLVGLLQRIADSAQK
jgi:pseudouridine synthase